ncbi:MAG: LPS biosynthesis protein WbpP, partial [Candidatus Aminicenantes bacterium]|nr:LPS biosynthesis protein WbpP [Candidatus Aminicenantes bacterium]
LAVKADSLKGEVFNIGYGEETSVNELTRKINEILKTNIRPAYDEPRLGDIKRSFADISWARKMLKYEPTVDFSEGLKRTIRWYKEGE